MESIQIFLKLEGLFKAKGHVPAKTILFTLNLDSWQKLVKNRSVGNIGFWCSYIIRMASHMPMAGPAICNTNYGLEFFWTLTIMFNSKSCKTIHFINTLMLQKTSKGNI